MILGSFLKREEMLPLFIDLLLASATSGCLYFLIYIKKEIQKYMEREHLCYAVSTYTYVYFRYL